MWRAVVAKSAWFLPNGCVLAIGKKLPPPPGCVDQQFTSLTAVAASTLPVHSELPPPKGDTPYALQVLLDLYREQFLAMVDFMKSDKFRQNIESQIAAEKVSSGETVTSKMYSEWSIIWYCFVVGT